MTLYDLINITTLVISITYTKMLLLLLLRGMYDARNRLYRVN